MSVCGASICQVEGIEIVSVLQEGISQGLKPGFLSGLRMSELKFGRISGAKTRLEA
jgi:hypothetical protein